MVIVSQHRRSADPSFACLPEELRELYDITRRRAGERIDPLVREIDRSGEFSRQLWDEIAAMDVIATAFEPAVGGLGLSWPAYVVAIEALATGGALAAMYTGTTAQVARALLRYGRSVAAQWVPRLVAGEAIGAWAFTEPQTGSDPRQITTTATRVADGWVLDGAKQFISFAAQCTVAVVFARTSEERIGAFLVETAQPGWQPGAPVGVLAFRGAGTAPVYLDGVHVAAEGLLGEPEQGFEILLAVEAEAKLRGAATCVGIAQRALEEAVRYALDRTHRGRPIGEKFAAIQLTLGEAAADVAAARALVWTVANALGRGADITAASAAARIVTGRTARQVSNAALQVCGAYGFTQDLVVERLYREAKFYEVAQGVIDLQKIIVAKNILSARPGGQ